MKTYLLIAGDNYYPSSDTGESEWVFINSGFPMNRAKGKSARDAVITAMGAK